MLRREFLGQFAGAVAACWPLTGWAQQPGRTYRVGMLVPRPLSRADERTKSLVARLATRGFIEGQNMLLDVRAGDGRYEQLLELAASLKASKSDVIISFGYPATLAAKTAAQGIPIVVSGAGDPVATGLADGLAHPGGDVTGMTEMSTELSAKRLEILKDALPNLKQVAMLWNAADLGMTLRYRAAETTAKLLGITVQTLGVREPNDFDEAFEAMTRSRPDAIMMVSDALTTLNRKRVIDFAASNRLPTIYELSPLVREGGLMSYGPNNSLVGERIGDFAAKILLGAKPADLPLEQPTKFEFVINLKTAKSLGLNLPPTLLARADEVIE